MIGELAALGAAISWTFSAILYRKALQQAKPISANIIRLSCTSAVLLLFLIVVGKFELLATLPWGIFALAAVSGVIGLGLGDTLYMMSLKSAGVARAVPITCTYSLFNLLWAIVFLHEEVTLAVVFGAIIIALGVWLLSHENQKDATDAQRRILIKGVVAALGTALLWSVSIAIMAMAVTAAADLDHALVVNSSIGDNRSSVTRLLTYY